MDIGYVRGILQGDEDDSASLPTRSGRTIRLPRGASDAALAPYHVDRSKLFALERLDSNEHLDAAQNRQSHRVITAFPTSRLVPT